MDQRGQGPYRVQCCAVCQRAWILSSGMIMWDDSCVLRVRLPLQVSRPPVKPDGSQCQVLSALNTIGADLLNC